MKRNISLIILLLIIGVFVITGCNRHHKELFKVILDYDRAIKEGNKKELQQLISYKSLLEIERIYQDKEKFITDLIDSGKPYRNEAPPKLKNIVMIDKEHYRVKVILFNGKQKTYFLVKDGNDWKIDFIPILGKLNEAEQKLRQ